jgi:hypothetical protein
MMPLSYQGFGFTAILVMVAVLSAAQLLRFLKERFHHPQQTVAPKPINRDSIKK